MANDPLEPIKKAKEARAIVNTIFDFNFLYKEKILDIGEMDNGEIVRVTVREIPHGKMASIQDSMLRHLDDDALSGGKANSNIQRSMVQSLKKGLISTGDFNDLQTVAAIKEWTLRDNDGNIAPVTLEVFRLLPHSITEMIEKAAEELNPSLDEDFQGKD